MSYAYSDYVRCPNLQQELNQQFLHNPQDTPWPNGALMFVASEMNTDGTLQQTISTGNGKLRTVELVYQPRFTDESSDSAVINCNGGDEYGDTSTTYQLDPEVGKSRSWKLTNENLITRCQSDSAWLAKQIQRHMNAIEHDIDIELAAFIEANKGQFYDQSGDNVNVQTLTSTQDYSSFAIGDIAFETERTQWGRPFVLIGDGAINKYMRAKEAGCCMRQGVDFREFAAQNPHVFVRDPEVPTALGNGDAFVALGAGAIQFIKYNEFESELMRMDDDSVKQGVIVNPNSGIAYDYLAKYDCGRWNFQLKIAYIFATLPQDAYRINDPLRGTNGILQFTVVNPAA
jgi:hypothetical protein